MRVARWKVMAGGLLLSAGGLMAVADGPPPLPGCQPLPAPLHLPAAELPPVQTRTGVLTLTPSCPAEPAPAPRPLKAIGYKLDNGISVYNKVPPTATGILVDPPGKQVIESRMSVRTDKPGTFISRVEIKDGKYCVTGPDGQPCGEVTVLSERTVTLPKPAEPHTTVYPDPKTADLPKPAFSAPVPPGTPVIVHPSPWVDSGQTPPSLPAQLAASLSAPLPPATDAVPPPAAPAPAVPAEKSFVAAGAAKPEPVPATAEKRLKVLLSMGDDRPRFEVRDGDEVYLKVVSDRVEVKSAADKGDAPTMKAAGKVGFVTPGGDGTCDELAILPGSGQVVAVGNVSFRHTWGRSETTVTAERMTFRLAHPGPTAIQAGYSPVK